MDRDMTIPAHPGAPVYPDKLRKKYIAETSPPRGGPGNACRTDPRRLSQPSSVVVKQMSSYLAVMLSGTRPGYGRV